jgi:hypothetical protein
MSRIDRGLNRVSTLKLSVRMYTLLRTPSFAQFERVGSICERRNVGAEYGKGYSQHDQGA